MNENNEKELADFETAAVTKMEERFAVADEKSMRIIEEYIAGGFYKTLAGLAVYIGKERADKLLSTLSEESRAGIEREMKELIGKDRTDPAIIAEAEQVLKKSSFCDKDMADFVLDGLGSAASSALLLKSEELFKQNPVLAKTAERYAFTFDDFDHLSDRDMQIILRELDMQLIAKALKGANTAVQEKVFVNMTHRAAEMLKEDMDFMGPVRRCDVEQARSKILDIVRRLNKQGDIYVLPAAADNDEYIQ